MNRLPDKSLSQAGACALGILCIVLAACIDFFAPPVSAADKETTARGIRYSWAGNRLEVELWGMAQGDIDSNSSTDTVVIERKRLRIGSLGEKGFEERFLCGWKSDADAARVYLVDLDSDGKDEAVISAVEAGMPSSLALKIDSDAKSCKEIFERARWSLRVINIPAEGNDAAAMRRALVGQGWSSQDFFTGPIVELKLKDGKLVMDHKLDLPRNTDIYHFVILPSVDGAARVVRLAGPAAMEVRQQHEGKGWKRVWRSGERLGGTSNVLAAEQRPLLDEVSSEYALFDITPLALNEPDGMHLIAPKFDMPLRNAVGRKPYIRGSELVMFRPDQVLTFVEEKRTQDLPGPILDYIMDKDRPGRMLVLVQENAGAFESSTKSFVLGFDLR